MTPELWLKMLLKETVEKTNRYHHRMKTLVTILEVIYTPLSLAPNTKVRTQHQEYDFDDLLILMFEFVQLMTTFKCHHEEEQCLNAFLTCHSARLTNLCLTGRLNYISEIVEFRRCLLSHPE